MRCLFDDAVTKLLIKVLREKADRAVDGVFAVSASALEADAKANAPWTDRTGNARRTLAGCTELTPYGRKTAAVVGKMSYSPNLELSYGGRYCILYPTVLKNVQGILADVVSAVGGVTL